MDDEPDARRPLRRFVPIWARPSTASPRLGRRQRFAQLAAGAAVLICLVGAWGIVRNPLGESGVRSGHLISSASGLGADVQHGPAAVSPKQQATSVPADFQLWSMSTAGGRMFALGSVSCGGERCPAVLTSTDAGTSSGTSWRLVHTFAHTDTSATSFGALPVIQPSGALSGITFVNATVGYIFGGDLWMTTDAGASFTRIAHPGSSVLDVVARGRSVDVLSAQGCVQGSCTGRLEIAQTTAGNTGPLPEPVAGVTPASAVASASLAGSGNSLLLLAQGAPGSSGNTPGAWRLDKTTLVGLPLRASCHENAVLAAAQTPNGGRVAVCDATPAASATSYSTLAADARGSAWKLLAAGSLSLPTEGRVDLVSTSGGRLVASTGGPRTAADGTNRADAGSPIALSSDGGRTWHSPKNPPRILGGLDSLVPCGGRVVVGVAHGGGSFWQSGDDGATWSEHSFHGRSG